MRLSHLLQGITSAVLVIRSILHWQCYTDGQTGGSSLAKRCGLRNRRLDFGYVLRGRNKCSGNGTITLLIGVLSSAANFEQRAAIRETWGASALKIGFKLVFLLGSTTRVGVENRILQEDGIHQDIVQGQFLDAYHNLTCKSMMLLHWAHDYCSDFLAGGSGYLISGDSIAPLLEASKTVAFHPLEDVYVTALLAQKAGIIRLEMKDLLAAPAALD
ncbi:UDP-GlcNAc:betaGal beta-1,3-N-acetylglucosaminyltransferase 9-like [Haemaphysalis longicornis]